MTEPVSLAEIKKHLDVVRDDQDVMLSGMGVAAREWVESYTGLTLTRREVTEVATSFDQLRTIAAWPLPVAPQTSIRYVDQAGADQILTGFAVRAWSRPSTITPGAGARWPIGGPVAVSFLAGYATPDDVPFQLKAAILLTVGNLTGLRVSEQEAIDNLCRPFRMPVIG